MPVSVLPLYRSYAAVDKWSDQLMDYLHNLGLNTTSAWENRTAWRDRCRGAPHLSNERRRRGVRRLVSAAPAVTPLCISKGWRADRSYGTCYCDQACTSTLDCCHDYELACPAVSCVVSEWSAWSGCAEPCRATLRMRSRQVLQEGEPCPHVEEHAGCAEYWDRRQCSKSLVPALITTGGYGNARKKRDIPVNNDDDVTGHCVQFQLTSLTHWCQRSVGPHTRWMQYLKEGHQVCVECQPPALAAGQRHCTGDCEEESGRQWGTPGVVLCGGE
ncbi:somatomedin-B and thrombospondin type-1 domain-containing protein-like isoform X2 [Oncorhynchus nerka]|uniref:somatomedin-B and thrombospondin type-1 domain-containing protein-like isoform X2 n=1 Tax=Oncorhynchus nerka TaxID=8023 RepID=UPI0031B81043